jgi:argininosuccinate lyase
MTNEDNVQLRERLSKDPSPTLVEYVSAPKIRTQLQYMFEPQMRIHFAHCVMLMKQGIISDADGATILRELRAMYDSGSDAITPDYSLEDVYSHIERHLIRKLGADVAGRLHTARSRNDMGVTSWRMVLRARLLEVRTSLLRTREVLLRKADEYKDAVAPGYTHSQHAQPITFGYFLAAFADVLERDARRLDAAYASNNLNPLGAAALTTTGFNIDRELTTHYLGFNEVLENGFDAVASRDDADEASCVLAMIGVHLSRIAEVLFVWHTSEFGFIEFDDEYANVSSIMPQKKNPGLLEFIKKKAGHLIGHSTQVLAASKSSWFTDAGDASDAGNEPLIEASASAIACLEMLAGALDSAEVRRERMADMARTGYGTMTEVADVIVRESGISFREAHNIVGKTVAVAVADGLDADEVTHEMLDATSQQLFSRPLGVSVDAIAQALDPAENINIRTTRGGPAPSEMSRMIKLRLATLSSDQQNHEAEVSRINARTEELLSVVQELSKA